MLGYQNELVGPYFMNQQAASDMRKRAVAALRRTVAAQPAASDGRVFSPRNGSSPLPAARAGAAGSYGNNCGESSRLCSF